RRARQAPGKLTRGIAGGPGGGEKSRRGFASPRRCGDRRQRSGRRAEARDHHLSVGGGRPVRGRDGVAGYAPLDGGRDCRQRAESSRGRRVGNRGGTRSRCRDQPHPRWPCRGSLRGDESRLLWARIPFARTRGGLATKVWGAGRQKPLMDTAAQGIFQRRWEEVSALEIRVDGKVALVTGASRGIGRGCALALGRAGAKVLVNYFRHREAAGEVVAAIEREGGRAMAWQADISDQIGRAHV